MTATQRLTLTAFVAYAFLITLLVPLSARAETPIVEPAGQELAENLGGRPTWIAILITITWGLTRLIKDPSVSINVPPRWRPALALGLAMLVGGLEAIARAGLTWPAFAEGLQSGFIAGSGAIVVQEVVVRWMLGGKTEPGTGPTVPPAATGLIAFVLVLGAGCGSRLQAAVATADSIAVAGETARPILRTLCVEPMQRAAEAHDEAKKAEIGRRCDVPIAAQDSLLSLHAALRAAIVSLHATGTAPPNLDDLLVEAGAAGFKLTQAIVALSDGDK